jgi:hypothetical protein
MRGSAHTLVMRLDYVRERVALDAVEDPIVRDGVTYWRSLCRGRAFPARADVTPHAMRKLLSHTIIARVVDGGVDYEYRIVGQVHVDFHKTPMQGSSLMTTKGFRAPYRTFLKSIYDEVVENRAPACSRSAVKMTESGSEHLHSESAFLPLGEDDKAVDHVLVFAVYAPYG